MGEFSKAPRKQVQTCTFTWVKQFNLDSNFAPIQLYHFRTLSSLPRPARAPIRPATKSWPPIALKLPIWPNKLGAHSSAKLSSDTLRRLQTQWSQPKSGANTRGSHTNVIGCHANCMIHARRPCESGRTRSHATGAPLGRPICSTRAQASSTWLQWRRRLERCDKS